MHASLKAKGLCDVPVAAEVEVEMFASRGLCKGSHGSQSWVPPAILRKTGPGVEDVITPEVTLSWCRSSGLCLQMPQPCFDTSKSVQEIQESLRVANIGMDLSFNL